MISYEPLWETMKRKKISQYKMSTYYHIPSSTFYRLKHGMGMSTVVLNDFCRILDCRVEDILLYVPDCDEGGAKEREKK